MTRKPLNVYRVYMDLFANFMSLVAFGGVAAAILGSGTASPGPAPPIGPVAANFAKNCEGGGDARIPRFAESKKNVTAIPRANDCSIRWQYPELRYGKSVVDVPGFIVEDGDVKGQGQETFHAFCNDMYNLAKYAKDTSTSEMPLTIAVAGHASSEYENTSKCGFSSNIMKANLKKRIQRAGNWQEVREGYNLVSNVPLIDSMSDDTNFCNLLIAWARARNAIDACHSYISRYPSSGTTGNENEVWKKLAPYVDPSNKLASKDEICRHISNPTAADECRRTVTLQLQLPHKS